MSWKGPTRTIEANSEVRGSYRDQTLTSVLFAPSSNLWSGSRWTCGGRDPAPLWCLLALRRIMLHSLNAWYWKEDAQQWWWPSAKTNHPKNQKRSFFLPTHSCFFPAPIILSLNQWVPSAFNPWLVCGHSPAGHWWYPGIPGTALLCPEISGPPQRLWQRTRVFLWFCN